MLAANDEALVNWCEAGRTPKVRTCHVIAAALYLPQCNTH